MPWMRMTEPLKQGWLISVRFFMKKIPVWPSLLPGFIYKYLEKIVHQEDINDFLTRFGDKYGIDFVRAAIRISM